MTQKLDSKIYQEALAILRDRHLREFERIRAKLMDEAGLKCRPNRALEVLTLLRKHKNKQYTPTDIAKAIGIQREVVSRALVRLENENKISVEYVSIGSYTKRYCQYIDDK